jgi:hypothetical protein
MDARREPPFALSIDVEDYFQVQAFAGRVSREDWPRFPPRVEENVARLLDLFDESGSKATFLHPRMDRAAASRSGWAHRRLRARGGVARRHAPDDHRALSCRLPRRGAARHGLRLRLERVPNPGSPVWLPGWGLPLVVNVHPWEIDPAQPSVGFSRLSKWTHYARLDRTEDILRRVLRSGRFAPIAARLSELGILDPPSGNGAP